jgi:hypothetical protein
MRTGKSDMTRKSNWQSYERKPRSDRWAGVAVLPPFASIEMDVSMKSGLHLLPMRLIKPFQMSHGPSPESTMTLGNARAPRVWMKRRSQKVFQA